MRKICRTTASRKLALAGGALAASFALGNVTRAQTIENYGPVAPPTWADRMETTLQAPFRGISRVMAKKPQAPPDRLSLNQGVGKATPPLYVAMGGVSERAGDVNQARHLYHKALELDPRSVDATISLARLEDRAGQFDPALRWYQQAAALNPNDATVANDFGLCFARSGRVGEALAPLAQAVRLEPQKALYRNNIAKVLVALDRPAEAAEHLAAVHDPATVNYNMAVLLLEMERVDEAARCLRMATSLNPQLAPANQLLAELHGPGVEHVAQRTLVEDQAAPPATQVAQSVPQSWPAEQQPSQSDDSVLPTPGGQGVAEVDQPTREPMLLPAVD